MIGIFAPPSLKTWVVLGLMLLLFFCVCISRVQGALLIVTWLLCVKKFRLPPMPGCMLYPTSHASCAENTLGTSPPANLEVRLLVPKEHGLTSTPMGGSMGGHNLAVAPTGFGVAQAPNSPAPRCSFLMPLPMGWVLKARRTQT